MGSTNPAALSLKIPIKHNLQNGIKIEFQQKFKMMTAFQLFTVCQNYAPRSRDLYANWDGGPKKIVENHPKKKI